MIRRRFVLIGLLAAAAAFSAQAQQPQAPAGEKPAATTVPKADAKGCPKVSMVPHNHAAEKGIGSLTTARCGPMAKVAKNKNAHNHGQFHKNQWHVAADRSLR
jgi:hypothetical protein